MKLQIIYKVLILVLLAILFQSRSAGPGDAQNLQVSGAPGSSGNLGTCGNSNCHTSGSFNPNLDISILDENQETVDTYIAGEEYSVDVSITSVENFSGSGMQMVALDQNGTSLGTWSLLPNTAQITQLGGRDYVEHSTPQTSPLWEFNWVAPATGAGEVTFYAAGIASNLNGSRIGDGVASSNVSLLEESTNSTSNSLTLVSDLQVAPNPIVDGNTMLSFSSIKAGTFDINVLNAIGQNVHTERIHAQIGSNHKSLELNNLISGLYFVQLTNKEQSITRQLVRL